MVVLDASAVLAFVFGERGADVVRPYLPSAMICAPNVVEVITRFIEKQWAREEATRVFIDLGLLVQPLDRNLALRAGALWVHGRARALSLGDRACLALAERERLPALTADRAWRGVDIGVEIRFIR